jgi:hypothetical protein
MQVSELNTFCRLNDLVYKEDELRDGHTHYHFIDYANNERVYSYFEISDALRQMHCRTSLTS